ncbi:glutamate racemase [Buchnera aphidicola (Acyrthosiphon lactucae)]|uniref:Glutamate racemase n=1 Tax=Buchnera aphidicola (Acyrthosiphon lactucae) TaxID=1241832 RepID=A0A4D6XSG3_9GAMM|nr:glutamate racemase [Buchnera aphidicola]QCI17927.1 glutamate racemase [Buchnera aphidicola (Acyrthosiphon lactucae)]
MLIFDSGVGGLSVLKTIKRILPKIHYIYILDNEAFPYGNKTEIFIIKRSIKIINTIKKIYPISIVVIACNTVSTVALSVLRNIFNFPIIGIFPSIKSAKKITKNKIIGLIATKATINSFYTKKIICKNSSSNTLKIIGTNKLALIAEKKIRGYSVSRIQLKNIFKPWIKLPIYPDTIILGCTHFSLLEEEIKNILCIRSPINFIDSIEIVASQIENYFNQLKMEQKIKKNIFLYSKKSDSLKSLLFFLKEYKFKIIKHINLY